jgi:hypothetical protein
MIVGVDVGSGECALCRPQLLTPVIRQSARWRIAVNRNRNLLGKLLIALRRHEESVANLTPTEWSELRDELRWAIARLNGAFRPDHFTRTWAGTEFGHPDWPGHYRPGVEYLAPPDVIAAIAEALA